MSTGELGILEDQPLRVAQNADESITLFAYDVQLDERRREIGRTRMDLSTATIVAQVKDKEGKIEGTPTAPSTFTTPTVTLTDAGKTFKETAVNKLVAIANSPTPANDGIFPVTGVPSANSFEYTNAAAVAEPPGPDTTYSISDIVIDKNSGNPSQILINPDQVNEITKGTAVMEIVGGDTAELELGEYLWDYWVHKGGRVKRMVKKSKFFIEDGVYEPTVTAPPPTAGTPASQTQQTRSFKFTVLVAGTSFAIPIPGSGMVDGTYVVMAHLEDRAGGANDVVFETPTASRIAAQFTLECSDTLEIGAVVNFILRDA